MTETLTPGRIGSATRMLKGLQAEGEKRIAVAFSGGKDSLAVLDLCCNVFGPGNVYPVYLYFCKEDVGLEGQILRFAERRWSFGKRLIRLPHPALKRMLEVSDGRTFSPERNDRLHQVKYTWNEVESIARKRGNLHWVAFGMRMQDSLNRRGMINKCNGVWRKTERGKFVYRCYPCYDWTHIDILSYLKARKLPLPLMKGAKAHKSSGTSPMSYTFMLALKKDNPAEYERLNRLFPGWKETMWQDQVRAKHNIAHNSHLETVKSLNLLED